MMGAVPYALRGNKVVRSDTGEVVKDHGSDHAKAVRHLRALKANVEESSPAVLGVLLEGFDAGEARDFHGRWLRTVAAVTKLNVGESHSASRSFKVTRVASSGDRQYRVTMKTNGRVGDHHVYAGTPQDAAHAALGRRPQPVQASATAVLGALLEGAELQEATLTAVADGWRA